MPLRLIIENTPCADIAPMPVHPSADFIEAALRTAKHSKAKTRAAIMADVSDVLGCRIEDLQFLFDHSAVPTRSRAVFNLEMPDYRMSQREIFEEAAE